MEPAGTQLSTDKPGNSHCGADISSWMIGEHPTDFGIEVERTVRYEFPLPLSTISCTKKIKVTKCNGYFVYFLPEIRFARYCGAKPKWNSANLIKRTISNIVHPLCLYLNY